MVPYRDAETFLNKQVKFKDLKNNAIPNSNMSYAVIFHYLCQSE